MIRYVATLLFAFSAVALGDGISRINGSIHVQEGQRTGDVFIGAGSRVDGGIHVDKNEGWFRLKPSGNPRVTVESGAVVSGPLKFEREVDLYLGSGAKIGPIAGVPPQRHALP
jgi:hypothetical protein